MASIIVGGDYTVAADQNLVFQDEPAFILDGAGGAQFPNLVIAGEVEVRQHDVGFFIAMTGRDGAGAGAAIHIQDGATYEVKAGAEGTIEGFELSFDALALVNDGTWRMHGRNDAVGGLLFGDLDFTNSGDFRVTGTDSAKGLHATGAGSLHNTGRIFVASEGAALGVVFGEAGSVLANDGLIRVKGAADPTIGLDVGAPASFENSGRIVVTDHGAASDCVAIQISSQSEHGLLTNSGLIQADVAFNDLFGDYEIDNSGKIVGAVMMSGLLVNTGSISGEISFGDRPDGYDGSHGRLNGAVHGAGGDDILLGGKSADAFHGDGGADSLDGGGGDDTLWGGANADTLNGGAGHDWFVFLDARESVTHRSDHIGGLDGGDVIDLSAIDADVTSDGDQSFRLIKALDGEAGELALVFDDHLHLTRLVGDVDGDGVGDLVVLIDGGDYTGFDNFVL